MRHLLSIQQLDLPAVERLFATADQLRPVAQGKNVLSLLEGAVLANLFFEPSTRTRLSFGTAFLRLGGRLLEVTEAEQLSYAKGESHADTSRVVSGYADVMVIRHAEIKTVYAYAAASTVPVINGGNGSGEHPTQALIDLYTLSKELKRSLPELNGLKIAFVGDLKYGRAVHSFAHLLGLLNNVHFSFISPAELALPNSIRQALTDRGHTLNNTAQLAEGLSDIDAIYTTRIQVERFPTPADALPFLQGHYAINAAVYQRFCRASTILMHPLPRDNAACELNNDLDTHPKLAIFRQADNGVPIRMALFAKLFGLTEQIPPALRSPRWRSQRNLSR